MCLNEITLLGLTPYPLPGPCQLVGFECSLAGYLPKTKESLLHNGSRRLAYRHDLTVVLCLRNPLLSLYLYSNFQERPFLSLHDWSFINYADDESKRTLNSVVNTSPVNGTSISKQINIYCMYIFNVLHKIYHITIISIY